MEQFEVAKIPLFTIPPSLTMHAGHIDAMSSSLFFLSLTKANAKRPVVLWLNGGPGCSSMDGLFLEIGPFRFVNGSAAANEHAWSNSVDIIFVDQPAGTGYSSGLPLNSSQSIISSLVEFWRQYELIFGSHKNVWLAGESFSGVWIPYVALELQKANVDVKGVMLGNPWIDPLVQYPTFLEFATLHRLVSDSDSEYLNQLDERCMEELASNRRNTVGNCELVMEKILESSQRNGQMCRNKYEYTLRDEKRNQGCGMHWPSGVAEMKAYLSRLDVQIALHTPYRGQWSECSWNVYENLLGDSILPSINVFPQLLKSVQVGIFVGDRDMVCNYIGLERSLKVERMDHFEYGQRSINGNLSYFRIKDGSHMTSFGHSNATLFMVQELIDSNIVQERGGRITALSFISLMLVVVVVLGVFVRGKMRKRESVEEEIEMIDVQEDDSIGNRRRYKEVRTDVD